MVQVDTHEIETVGLGLKGLIHIMENFTLSNSVLVLKLTTLDQPFQSYVCEPKLKASLRDSRTLRLFISPEGMMRRTVMRRTVPEGNR